MRKHLSNKTEISDVRNLCQNDHAVCGCWPWQIPMKHILESAARTYIKYIPLAAAKISEQMKLRSVQKFIRCYDLTFKKPQLLRGKDTFHSNWRHGMAACQPWHVMLLEGWAEKITPNTPNKTHPKALLLPARSSLKKTINTPTNSNPCPNIQATCMVNWIASSPGSSFFQNVQMEAHATC